MHYADPLTVTCPGCDTKSSHSVAKLRALEGECPHCHHALREIGERMNEQVDDVADFTVATVISLAIEDLDSRIAFSGEDCETVKCLSDLVKLVDEKIARLKSKDPALTGRELVDRALATTFPSVDSPSQHRPLHEVFSGHKYLLPGEKRR